MPDPEIACCDDMPPAFRRPGDCASVTFAERIDSWIRPRHDMLRPTHKGKHAVLPARRDCRHAGEARGRHSEPVKWRKQNRGSFRFRECSAMSASAATSAVALEVTVVIAVPSMIVNDHAAITCPIPLEIHVSIVPGGNPARTGIRRPRPVPVMPHVMTFDRIPVALDPDVLGLRRRRWRHVHHLRRRRWTDLNSD